MLDISNFLLRRLLISIEYHNTFAQAATCERTWCQSARWCWSSQLEDWWSDLVTGRQRGLDGLATTLQLWLFNRCRSPPYRPAAVITIIIIITIRTYIYTGTYSLVDGLLAANHIQVGLSQAAQSRCTVVRPMQNQ